MASAVETPPHLKTAAGPTFGLLPASLVGAALLVAALSVVGIGVSKLITEILPSAGLLKYSLPAIAIVAAVVLVFRIIGSNGPKGARGGAFLAFCCLALTAMLGRAVAMWMEGTDFVGQVITGLALAGLLFGSYKLLTGDRGRRWMPALDSHGWFDAYSYKKSQGQRVRKWTMIGILLVGGSGVYAIVLQEMIPTGDWNPAIPYLNVRVPVLPAVQYTVPILLSVLTVWLAWRAVNVPPFADFLIATEAEMNKVSWTPLKKLVRDAVVVLVFTALLTGFLLTVDLFWGWTLSTFGVLPDKAPPPADVTGVGAEW